MLQEQQWSKEVDEKSDDKTQDKGKSETDEEKDTITSMVDEESQGDSSESKVRTHIKVKIHSTLNKYIINSYIYCISVK